MSSARLPRICLAITALVCILVSLLAGKAASNDTAGPSIDFGSALVDGHQLLGRSVAGVTAAFGRPTWRESSGSRFRLVYGDRMNFRMLVLFRREQGVFRAVTVAFEKQPVFEQRTGTNLLAVPPRAAAERTRAEYRNIRLERPWRCKSGICTVVLRAVGTSYHVTFGRTDAHGSYISIWKA